MNFNNDGKILYGNNVVFEGDMSVDLNNDIDIMVNIKAPSAFEDFSLSFKHTGNLKNFHCQGEAKLNGQSIVVLDASFSMGNTIEGDFKFTCPFCEMIQSHFSVERINDVRNFDSKASLTFNNAKIVEVDAKFSALNGLEGDLAISSDYIMQKSFQFNMNKDSKKITSFLKVSYAPSKDITTNLNIDLISENAFNAKFIVSTPFQQLRQLDI